MLADIMVAILVKSSGVIVDEIWAEEARLVYTQVEQAHLERLKDNRKLCSRVRHQNH